PARVARGAGRRPRRRSGTRPAGRGLPGGPAPASRRRRRGRRPRRRGRRGGRARARAAVTFAGHVGALREGSYLHVVNYHWTPASTASRLEADLAAYQRHLDPVLPEHLEHFFAT